MSGIVISLQDDPFFDTLQDVLVGTATVFLQSLAYGLDFTDEAMVSKS